MSNVRQIRKDRGLTREQLAVASGTSVSSITRAESGVSLNTATLRKIAAALECKVSDLIDEEVA